MKLYHAHVYYLPEQKAQASDLFQLARLRHQVDFEVWKFFSEKVGPHALPMFELHFTSENERAAVTWLLANRGLLTVLIHEDTGCDLEDHLERAYWLGKPLPLRYEFFEAVKKDPHLAIHLANTSNLKEHEC